MEIRARILDHLHDVARIRLHARLLIVEATRGRAHDRQLAAPVNHAHEGIAQRLHIARRDDEAAFRLDHVLRPHVFRDDERPRQHARLERGQRTGLVARGHHHHIGLRDDAGLFNRIGDKPQILDALSFVHFGKKPRAKRRRTLDGRAGKTQTRAAAVVLGHGLPGTQQHVISLALLDAAQLDESDGLARTRHMRAGGVRHVLDAVVDDTRRTTRVGRNRLSRIFADAYDARVPAQKARAQRISREEERQVLSFTDVPNERKTAVQRSNEGSRGDGVADAGVESPRALRGFPRACPSERDAGHVDADRRKLLFKRPAAGRPYLDRISRGQQHLGHAQKTAKRARVGHLGRDEQDAPNRNDLRIRWSACTRSGDVVGCSFTFTNSGSNQSAFARFGRHSLAVARHKSFGPREQKTRLLLDLGRVKLHEGLPCRGSAHHRPRVIDETPVHSTAVGRLAQGGHKRACRRIGADARLESQPARSLAPVVGESNHAALNLVNLGRVDRRMRHAHKHGVSPFIKLVRSKRGLFRGEEVFQGHMAQLNLLYPLAGTGRHALQKVTPVLHIACVDEKPARLQGARRSLLLVCTQQGANNLDVHLGHVHAHELRKGMPARARPPYVDDQDFSRPGKHLGEIGLGRFAAFRIVCLDNRMAAIDEIFKLPLAQRTRKNARVYIVLLQFRYEIGKSRFGENGRQRLGPCVRTRPAHDTTTHIVVVICAACGLHDGLTRNLQIARIMIAEMGGVELVKNLAITRREQNTVATLARGQLIKPLTIAPGEYAADAIAVPKQ